MASVIILAAPAIAMGIKAALEAIYSQDREAAKITLRQIIFYGIVVLVEIYLLHLLRGRIG